MTIPNPVLIPAQRHELILKHLSAHKISSCATLADYLQVSESTIRRDLEALENQGLVERTRGGAILNEHIRAEAEYVQRAQRFIEEKRLIGKVAATLIEPGDLVFINSGTTTAQLIQSIHGIPKTFDWQSCCYPNRARRPGVHQLWHNHRSTDSKYSWYL